MATSKDKKFAAVLDRVLSDPAFAKKMERDPEGTLTSAGFKLTAAQRRSIAAPSRTVDVESSKVALVRPVVSIITKGTKPVVQVAVSSVAVSKTELKTAPKQGAKKRAAAKRKR